MRLIDADVFLKNCLCHLEIMVGRGNGKTIISAARQIAKEIMKETVEKMPTVEAKPVVHAHWVTDFDFDPEEEQELYFYFCSKCKKELFGDKEDFKYCPYCGAQMDESVNKTDELNSSEKTNNLKDAICGATNLPCSECMPCCESKKENGNGT